MIKVYASYPTYCSITDALIGSREELVRSFKGKRGARRFVQGAVRRASFDPEVWFIARENGKEVHLGRKTWKEEPVPVADYDFIPF